MSELPHPERTIDTCAPPMIRRGVVRGVPRFVLMLEGAVVLTAASVAYFRLDGGWLMFVLLFLVPDASMVGYLKNPRIGAIVYNVGHSYVLPAALAAVGVSLAQQTGWLIALIWTAHIGLDRMIGAGLKYPTAFGDTHLSKAYR